MITIHLVDGRHVLVLTCDRCQERIANHADGIALYDTSGAPMRFVHRRCLEEATASGDAQTSAPAHQPQPSGGHQHALPLDAALAELIMNIGVNWDEAVRNRTKWEMLSE